MQSTDSPPKSEEWHHLKNMKKRGVSNSLSGLWRQEEMRRQNVASAESVAGGNVASKSVASSTAIFLEICLTEMYSEPGTKVLNCLPAPWMNDELPKSSRNPKASPMFENCCNNINKNSPPPLFLILDKRVSYVAPYSSSKFARNSRRSMRMIMRLQLWRTCSRAKLTPMQLELPRGQAGLIFQLSRGFLVGRFGVSFHGVFLEHFCWEDKMLKVEKNNENRTSGKVGHNWRFRLTKQIKLKSTSK